VKERVYLENLCSDEKLMLKLILKIMGRRTLDLSGTK
jgi:hypothetical protein